jgi:hypothetical protein
MQTGTCTTLRRRGILTSWGCRLGVWGCSSSSRTGLRGMSRAEGRGSERRGGGRSSGSSLREREDSKCQRCSSGLSVTLRPEVLQDCRRLGGTTPHRVPLRWQVMGLLLLEVMGLRMKEHLVGRRRRGSAWLQRPGANTPRSSNNNSSSISRMSKKLCRCPVTQC